VFVPGTRFDWRNFYFGQRRRQRAAYVGRFGDEEWAAGVTIGGDEGGEAGSRLDLRDGGLKLTTAR